MFALSSKNLEVTPEKIRSFLPSVNWDRLGSMYLPGRSGAECEARYFSFVNYFKLLCLISLS